MTQVRRPNARKPWIAEEAELRCLAGEGVPVREIAARLGRTPAGITNRAERLGIRLSLGSAARAVAREEALRCRRP